MEVLPGHPTVRDLYDRVVGHCNFLKRPDPGFSGVFRGVLSVIEVEAPVLTMCRNDECGVHVLIESNRRRPSDMESPCL